MDPDSGNRVTGAGTEQNKDRKEAAPFDGFSFSDPFHSFLATTRRVILQPVGFFSVISSKKNIIGAFIFALICIEIGTILDRFLDFIALNFYRSSAILIQIISLTIVMLIVATILLFAGAFILHILVVILVNSGSLSWDSGFWATFKVASYACVTALVVWVPVLGPLLMLYSIYIIFAGVRQMHRRPQAGLRR